MMNTINYLCADEESTDLAEFSQRIFGALRALDGTQRSSSNYLEDIYFVGKIEGGRVTAALSDEVGFDDLPYWLCIEMEDDEMQQRVESLIRAVSSATGMQVAKIENFGKKNMRRINY